MKAQSGVRKMILFCASAVCVGRGLEHFGQGSGIFFSLLWDEKLLSPWVEGLGGLSWSEYVRSTAVENFIHGMTWVVGFWLVVAGLLFPFLKNRSFWALSAGSILFVEAVLDARSHSPYALPIFMEAGIQVLTPLLVSGWGPFKHWRRWALAAIASCFLGHGLFALDIYPRPGHFLDFVIDVLGCSEEVARGILLAAGIGDVLAVLALGVGRLRPWALLYCTVWGLTTALARSTPALWPLWQPEHLGQLLGPTLWRLSHGLLPWTVFLSLRKEAA